MTGDLFPDFEPDNDGSAHSPADPFPTNPKQLAYEATRKRWAQLNDLPYGVSGRGAKLAGEKGVK